MTYKTFKKYNLIFAWATFFIAFITYYLTAEPSVSLWDCGEFIASSYKLEVGHPPGAPFFMLLARFFSLFASSVANVAFMINLVSVTASAFTILFLFWIISYFAEKILIKNKEKFKAADAYAVLLSSFVGALIYTFSDTFWFSAVEAEVYASSSLFTALVFWAVLKWETISDKQYSDRWLIFIALLMGISIGVHLLNLLAIPAIVFVIYFKKFNVTKKGVLYASLISILLLGFVMYGIIQGYIVLAAKFELLFVNSFGLPYNSGLFAYILFTFGLLIFGIYYTFKKKKVIWNTALTMILVILIGYSSFTLIMIRSYANPPMDENNPENVFALLSYLNREQYGSRPLIYGNYYNAKFQKDEYGDIKFIKQYTYIPENGKYLKIEKTNPEYLYESSGKTIFPRMYSRDKNHIAAYQSWAGIKPGENPTFINNLNFFFKYQLGHMYFRYFMWNFSGRQNNLQSYGGITKGNWISGIPFVDKAIIGNQKSLPDKIKNEKSRNKYYLLPFILGIIGLLYSLKKDKKNFTVITLLFFFTGIAIVMYLNQTPYQPRERDYAYAGSFFAFAIWAGLGATSVYSFISEKLKGKTALVLTVLLTIPVPAIMAEQNWDDHDRSERFTARDFAEDYLNSCEKNAILFTYGDNDTFPLWYLQEVEGIRTDIKVVNLSLLGTDWYIDQIRRKTYKADPVPFKMEHDKYREGKRDAVYITDNSDVFINEKYKTLKNNYEDKISSLRTQLISLLSGSEYAVQNPDEFNKLKIVADTFLPAEIAGITGTLASNEFIKKYKLDKNKINNFYNNVKSLIDSISDEYLPLKNAMDFVASDNKNTQLESSKGDRINYIPSKKLLLEVPWPEAAKTGRFNLKERSLFRKFLKWELNKNYIYKNDMAVLEIIARNNWKRPIYFATSVPSSNYEGLGSYLRKEGFALRLVPYKTKENDVYINSDILYDFLMNKAKWGNIDKHINADNFIQRTVRIMDIRGTFTELAKKLLEEGKRDKAVKVLDKCIETVPEFNFEYGYDMFDITELYFQAGETEKANEIIDIIYNDASQYLKYYQAFSDRFKNEIVQEKSETLAVANQFAELAEKYKQDKTATKIKNLVNMYLYQ